MKRFCPTALLLFCAVLIARQNAAATPADSVLSAVTKKLNSLQNLQHTITREMNYPAENYHQAVSWHCFYDFTKTGNALGFAYQVEDGGNKFIFNGTEKFDLDKKNKTAVITRQPERDVFDGASFFYNSVITIKNMLPLIMADKAAAKSVSDTVVSGAKYILVSVNTGKRRAQNLGDGFDKMETAYDFIYTLLIQPGTYLPYEMIQRFGPGFIKTTFTEYKANTAAPEETSWYYSTYSGIYKEAAAKQPPQLLAAGNMAPSWMLTEYATGKTVSLNDLKGRVVLIDFWIKNCGACIKSVPFLNSLKSRFMNSRFTLVGINAYDAAEDITFFCTKNKVEYPVLKDGLAAGEKYGVSGYPAFFVIDKNGRLVYSAAGYNESRHAEIEKVITSALK